MRKIVEDVRPHFNSFKTTQDRKYALYATLRHITVDCLKVDLMRGSNQVVIILDGVERYNSDLDQMTVPEFEDFFAQLLLDVFNRVGEHVAPEICEDCNHPLIEHRPDGLCKICLMRSMEMGRWSGSPCA